ncbi:tetratricopeptide repeat protein [Christiangramia sp.]|uniref:tetratricopeptide repeat protein n=1 Tax=Christiangramia sp. TaxID=1931228 RepID=UPI00262B6AB1|nr:tetratricopeptide repeat protein [Christiangramia sp.]
MGALIKLRWSICLLILCFTTSLLAQKDAQGDMMESLYNAYKTNGAKEALKVYEKNNPNKEYEGMAEPLNMLGYRLMQEDEDLKAAEIILKAQIEEYPDEANPYDSYSDVLLEMGKHEEAIKYIEKSLAIAEKHEHEQDDLIIEAGKAKMAIMNNKDKQLNFLVGNWDNETKVFQNGEETNNSKSSNEISFDSAGSMLIVDHDTAGDKPCCKRVMVYNPANDEFDVAFMRKNQPIGIRTSKIQVTEVSPDHYELMENYINENDEEVKLKHDIKKNSDQVEWITYNSKDSGWEKVSAMNLKKKD